MKVKLNGNMVTLVSQIKFTDLEKVGELEVVDTKTNETIFVCKADPCNQGINDFSAVFGYANAEGFACMNIGLPTCPDSPIDVQKECIADGLGSAIAMFDQFETHLIEDINKTLESRKTLMDSIELA